MPKKSKRRTPRANKSPPSNLSPEAIEHKAREDLASGRHREAIAGFKQLFKLEPRPAWRSALADAYAGRARELAAKDMLKEALAIWENRGSLGAGIAFDPEGQAEVGDVNLSGIVDQDVRRLDISMDDPFVVSVVDRLGDCLDDSRRFFR